jgi:ribosome-associated translation inhibitor RaiA
MKLSISYELEEWRESVEKETQRHVVKLGKLLKRYAPDLVQLRCSVGKRPRTQAYLYSLNLSLPTGTLRATGEGRNVRNSVKTAFAEIETHIKKHMAILRKHYR